jgi:hypothetical protein
VSYVGPTLIPCGEPFCSVEDITALSRFSDGSEAGSTSRRNLIWLVELDVDTEFTQERPFIGPGAFPYGAFPFCGSFNLIEPLLVKTTLRFANRGMIFGESDDHVEGRLLPLTVRKYLPYRNDDQTFDAISQTSIGEVQLSNSDGALDFIPDTYLVEGRPIRMLVAEAFDDSYGRLIPPTLNQFSVVFTGVIDSWFAEIDDVRIKVNDTLVRLESAVVRNRYPDATEDNPQAVSRYLPYALGQCRNIALVREDPLNLVFRAHSGPIFTVDEVRDQAVPLNFLGDYPTLTDLLALTTDYNPPADDGVPPDLGLGFYATCLADGLVRLGGLPAGVVTADIHGEGSYQTTDEAFSDGTLFSDGTGWRNRLPDPIFSPQAPPSPFVALAPVPDQAPYPVSTTWNQLVLSGSATVFGTNADQWPTTRTPTDTVLAPWGDGNGFNNDQPRSSLGISEISGTPPSLTGVDRYQSGTVVDNRKPNAILHIGGTTVVLWHCNQTLDSRTGTYAAISTDSGDNFTFHETSAQKIFSTTAPTPLQVIGVLQLGPGYTAAGTGIDTNYAYVFLNNSGNLSAPFVGTNGKVWMARVKFRGGSDTTANFWDSSKYSYFNGLDALGNPTWASALNLTKYVYYEPGGMGKHFQCGWNEDNSRYFSALTPTASTLAVHESVNPWGSGIWRQLFRGHGSDPQWTGIFTASVPGGWTTTSLLWLAVSGNPPDDLEVQSAALVAVTPPPTLGFSSTFSIVKPNTAGGAAVTASFTITRSGDPSVPVSVFYRLTGRGISPIVAADVGGTLPDNLITIPAGSNDYIGTIAFSAQDLLVDHTGTVTLHNPTGGTLAGTLSFDITLLLNSTIIIVVPPGEEAFSDGTLFTDGHGWVHKIVEILDEPFSDGTRFTDTTGWFPVSDDGDGGGGGGGGIIVPYLETIAALGVRLLKEYAQAPIDTYLDENSWTSIDAIRPFVGGFFFQPDTEYTIKDVLTLFLQSLNCCLILDNNGKYVLQQLQKPSAGYNYKLTTSNIKRFSLQKLKLPWVYPLAVWRGNYNVNNHPHSDVEVAGIVTGGDRVNAQLAFSTVDAIDRVLRQIYFDRGPGIIQTVLKNRDNTLTLLKERLALYNRGTEMYSMTVFGMTGKLQLLKTVQVTHPRFGLSQGKNMLITDITEQSGGRTTDVVVWG